MYEANFEFPYREPLECDFEICQPHLQADLIVNAVIGDKHFTFEQGIASDTWIIQHNLNKRPSVFVVDSANCVQIPDEIVYDSDNQVTVQFISAFAGKAYLN